MLMRIRIFNSNKFVGISLKEIWFYEIQIIHLEYEIHYSLIHYMFIPFWIIEPYWFPSRKHAYIILTPLNPTFI